MPEWPKGRDWKSRECPQGVPMVRIPLSPPHRPEFPLGSPQISSAPPIISIVIGEIKLPTRSIFPIIGNRKEGEMHFRDPAHEPVPSVRFLSRNLRVGVLIESLRFVPHPIIPRRVMPHEAGIIICSSPSAGRIV
jgi:hypothetical protein